ncbi:MAG: hypothetical protein J6X94_14240 [Lachnospiraceae bacterium]|nr:hypothetical protein [Lachnospiraceae bacterium]
MESVYFGKEPTTSFSYDGNIFPKELKEKEYYFPDENSTKLKTVGIVSAILKSTLFDLIIIGLLFPILLILAEEYTPLIPLIDSNIIVLVGDIVILLSVPSSLIYILIHNIGREKIFVVDNGTIYVIKMPVYVNIFKKWPFSSVEKNEQKVHAYYSKLITKIDRYIERGSLRIRKTLTDCKESDDIYENGKQFSGYNDKKNTDEDITIPSNYRKYVSSENYAVGKIKPKFIIYLIKYAYIVAYIYWIINLAVTRWNVYNTYFPLYEQSKIVALSPLGLEDRPTFLRYDHDLEFIHFIDTSDDYLNNSVRINFDIKEYGAIKDSYVSIDYDFYEGDDYGILKDILYATFDEQDLPDLSVIDECINDYLQTGSENGIYPKTVMTDNLYFTVKVSESYWADYSVYIYVSYLDRELKFF